MSAEKIIIHPVDCLIELKSFVGLLRYMVEQARPDDGMGDVFFTLANAADAIHANLAESLAKHAKHAD